MANTFAEKATKYVAILDEIYQRESLTSFLEMDADTVMWDGTQAVKLPKIAVDGAADYDRVNGYNTGNISVTYGSYTLDYDRGRSFDVDVIDDDEAAFNVFASAAREYVRTKEIPETDAIRFSEMYAKATAGSGTIVTADLDNTDALQAYDTAELTLGDLEVSEESRIMWASYEYYKNLKQSTAISRRIDSGDVTVNGINRTVALLDGQTPIIRVPKGRFYDIIQLNDGTTAGQEAGHFEPIVATSRELNFIYADRGAMSAVTKRKVSKVIGWEQNQSADANSVYYRNHHDLFVPDNKTQGLYIHRKALAIT